MGAAGMRSIMHDLSDAVPKIRSRLSSSLETDWGPKPEIPFGALSCLIALPITLLDALCKSNRGAAGPSLDSLDSLDSLGSLGSLGSS